MNNHKMTIFIAGDSTAERKEENERPESGWGEYLSDYFHSDVFVENHAMGGRSTKSFLDQNRFEPILDKMSAGDYLLIQFGHNDQKVEDPERYADPYGAYQENLTFFISETRKRGATPILLTSISRRYFTDDKVDVDSLGEYPKAMKKVAEKEHVLCADIHKLSLALLNELGEEESKKLHLHLEAGEYDNYPDGLVDNTHFSEIGAKTYAKMIALELAKLEEPLNEKINKEKIS